MSYTVAEVNDVLKRGKWVGTFETIEAAQAYIKRQAPHYRDFMRLRINEGTPRDPGREVPNTEVRGMA